jgi:hemolysin III
MPGGTSGLDDRTLLRLSTARLSGPARPLSALMGAVIFIAAWSSAPVGAVFKLIWIDAPGCLISTTYIAIGWMAVIAIPELVDRLGVTAIGALAFGGILYIAGAVVYARKRPDPVPMVFGHHELFHLLVILGAALQCAVMAFWIV